ncbi:MAG: hypothetical protein SVX38_08910 [Chloroflexota bacterium]|nr:hypothetical protein [Chloroflexota bacterium]
MCGLVGVLLYPSSRSDDDWQTIRTLFTRMLISHEERGREAAGLALVQGDGSCHTVKKPVTASEFVQSEEYHELLRLSGAGTTCLLGHTRMPTKGSPLSAANNHPLRTAHTVGIHNGTILNDDELFVRLSLPRQGQVDSEIIFRLLDGVNPVSENGRYLALVRRRVSLLLGYFSTLSIDLRHPTQLLVLKHMMPLCLHYEPDLQALFFNSRYMFLRQAFGRAVIAEALQAERGYIFDAERLPELGQAPVQSFSLSNNGLMW